MTKYNKHEEITSIKHRNSKQNKRSGLSSDQHLCGYGTHRTFYFSGVEPQFGDRLNLGFTRFASEAGGGNLALIPWLVTLDKTCMNLYIEYA